MKAVCWDYNGTIVSDTGNLRANVEEVINDFATRGIESVISTRDLQPQHTFGRQVFSDATPHYQQTKNYQKALQHLGITDAMAQALCIGDRNEDRPTDKSMVFLLDPSGVRTDAYIIKDIVDMLGDDFGAGYNALKQEEVNFVSEARFVYYGIVDLSQSYKALLMDMHFDDGVQPVIQLVNPDATKKLAMFEVRL